MANVIGNGKDRHLVDADGDSLDDGAGKLNVNATLVAGASIDIGDVDMFLDGGTAVVGGNGASTSGTLRVTIASDTTGVLSIDDNGGSITVDGTITANLGATDNAVLDAMVVDLAAMEALLIGIDSDTNLINQSSSAVKDAIENIEGALSGSELQVDVVAALPAGSNAIGKLAANSGVDIGDVDVTSTVQAVGYGTVTSSDFVDIDNAAEQLPAGACKELVLQADEDNTGYIMVGSSSSVSATNGIKMNAGDTFTLNIANRDLMFAWGSAADQKLRTMILT